jgi:membrane-bound serine protease (ClpP class)
VDPITAAYVARGLRRAEQENARLVILILDTPGGLDSSMRSITKLILGSPVPVAAYVYPSGARAASAGAFIGLASQLLVLAPGTNIGAAHPVDLQGQQASEKITNDAQAYIIGLARQHGRNETLAGHLVDKSVSLAAEDAVRQGLADFTAPSLPDLLRQAQGKKVMVHETPRTLELQGVRILNLPMQARESFFHRLTNPNIAYVLFLIGIYGIIYELASPGAILPGVAGAISLVLALMGLEGLPVSNAGILLLVLGAAMLVLEAFVVSHGILALGGIVALILGSLVIFPSDLPSFRIATAVLWTMIVLSTVFVGALVLIVLKFRHRGHLFSGMESLIHARGIVKSQGPDSLQVHVQGEDWLAKSDDSLHPGDAVEVMAVEGLTLQVRRALPETKI